jgi:Spy/CpxP family protein refolding chaperone
VFIRTAIAVLVTAFIIEAGAAFAQTAPAPGPQPGGPAATHHHDRGALFRDLNLTPDQTAKIKAIRERYRAKNQNLTDRAQRRANMKAQRDEIMTVLTPEQRQKLQQRISQLRTRWREHQEGAPAPAPTQ